MGKGEWKVLQKHSLHAHYTPPPHVSVFFIFTQGEYNRRIPHRESLHIRPDATTDTKSSTDCLFFIRHTIRIKLPTHMSTAKKPPR